MFAQQLTDDMRRFIDELIRKRRQKQASAAKGRAIDCMELEDRILLSASPIAPEAAVNKPAPDAQQATPQNAKAVAADANGNHVVVWSSQNANGTWAVNAQRFSAAGVAKGAEIQVSSQPSDEQQEATVSMNANGTFAITWTNKNSENGSADVYAKLFNADGSAKTGEILVNSLTGTDVTAQAHSSVAMKGSNGFVVTWSSQGQDGDGWGVFGKQFDSMGGQVAPEFQINMDGAGDQLYSRVAADASGNFTVIWQSQDDSGTGIFGQQFDSTGHRLGSEFEVNATTAGNQVNANIAMNSAGNFIVTWSSEGQDGSGYGIYAQRFNARAVPVNGQYHTREGGEFLVNATTDDNQDFSAVAMDNSGQFLITWSSYNQDALGTWGVFSQAYSADGAVRGPETRVNSTIAGSQSNSSAAFVGANSYVIAWSGRGVGDTAGVFSSVSDMSLLGQYVNQAPDCTVPGAQAIKTNQVVTFSAANGNAITVADPNIDKNSYVPISNSDFESYQIDSIQHGGECDGWQFSDYDGITSASGFARNGSGWQNYYAPSGNQVGVIYGHGSMSQEVYFSEAGNYMISFKASYLVWDGFSGANPISVKVDDVEIGVLTPRSSEWDCYDLLRTNAFAVTAGSHTVTFTGMTEDWVNRTTFIDQVSIQKTLQMSLAVDHGTLKLSTTNGLTFSAGTGSNDTTMTFTGTLADMNAALEGLQYTSELNHTGTTTLRVGASDLVVESSGGAMTDAATVAINVTAPTQTEGLLGTYYNRTNLALGKTATQSSNYDGWYYASFAVDGDPSNFTHTNGYCGEWWKVDFGAGTDVALNQIQLRNRPDDAGERLQNFTISVIGHDGNVVWSQHYDEPTGTGEMLTFDTGNISGQYVKIEKDGILSLGEVMIFNTVPVERIDSQIDFNWGNENPPAPQVDGTNWMATWQGEVQTEEEGVYTFSVNADDGYRLWVDDELLFDSWTSGGSRSGSIILGEHASYSIRLDYNQGGGYESVQLKWSHGDVVDEVITSDHLSYAGIFTGSSEAPSNEVPPAQEGKLNQPLVFSEAKGNAIHVSDAEASQPSDVVVMVRNSSFESYQVGEHYGNYVDGGSYDGWQLSARTWSAGVESTASLAGYPSAWANPPAPTENQVAAIFGYGSMSQDITFTEAGNYSLTLQAAYLEYEGFSGTNPISVRIDGVEVDVITPGTTDFRAYTTKGFTVTEGVHTLTFRGLAPNGGCKTSYIDDVSITKNANVLQVNLSVDSGKLTLSNTAGLKFTSGDGVNDASMTFLGTAADINAALEGLEFMPALNFTNTATLSITTTDMNSYINGGPRSSTTDTVAINVAVPAQTQGLVGTYYNRTNLALGKIATQSSNYDDWYFANFAIDGTVDSTTCTSNGRNEWWQVDLGAGTDVALNQIKVFNNTGGCGERLQDFTVSVIAHDGSIVWSQSYNKTTVTGEVLTFNPGNISGQYVRIQKNDSNYLSLSEVQVFNTVPVERVDSKIDFNWGNERSPAPLVDGTNWTASWQGQVLTNDSDAETEEYTFSVTGDDGFKLWVNDQLLFDNWSSGGTNSGTITLARNTLYSIRLDYNQGAGNESVQLNWSSASLIEDRKDGVIPSDHLSCASLIAPAAAPVLSLEAREQASVINQPLVFSEANGNAIRVSNTATSNVIVAVDESSFETPEITHPSGTLTNPPDNGWHYTVEIADPIVDGGTAAKLVANNSVYNNPDAPNGGAQAVAIDGHGMISQDITFTEAGSYSVNFWAAFGDYDWSAAWATVPPTHHANPISVRIDGVEVDVITPESAIEYNLYQTKAFSVTAGIHTLSFAGLNPEQGYTTSFIDDVSITRNASVLKVNLSVSNGGLTLASTNGLTFIDGDGAQDASMTILGTADDINAALEGMQFVPITANFHEDANLKITVTSFESAINGGPKSTSDSVAIRVAAPTQFQGLLGTYQNTSSGANLAIGKTATLTDAWPGYPASNAVDGKVDTSDDRNFFHTLGTTNAVWELDLSPGANTQLNQIKLVNTVEYGYRLQNFTISVIAADGSTVWSKTYNQETYDNEVLTFNTGDISGEFVRIQKNDTQVFHLAEVEVYNVVPATVRVDSAVDFNWANDASPAPGISGTDWSATWQGKVRIDNTEAYSFSATGNDSVRVWVNGRLAYDAEHPDETITLEKDHWYSIRMEYTHRDGDQPVALLWSSEHEGGPVAIASDHLSCQDLVQNADAPPAISGPTNPTIGINSTHTFSSNTNNAITIADSGTVAPTTFVSVENSSFESPYVGEHDAWDDGDYGGWHFANGAGITSNDCRDYNNPDAVDGRQVARIQWQGSMSQTVNFAETGDYSVKFLSAFRYKSLVGNTISVRIDGVEVGRITPTTHESYQWCETGPFHASAGQHELTFVGLCPGGNDQMTFIDQVTIPKVEGALVQVKLSVDHGTFSLRGSNSGVAMSNDIRNVTEITLTGTAANINAALDGLVYMPEVNFDDTAKLTITTNTATSLMMGTPQIKTIDLKYAVPTTTTGLVATYYNNTNLSGPGVQRVDSAIDFDIPWSGVGDSLTTPGIPQENWSARWQGSIEAPATGWYTFHVTADDGFRFWVNDAKIDHWGDQSATTYTVRTYLKAGESYGIKMEYYNAGADAKIKLEWALDGQDTELVPASQLSHENAKPVNTVPTEQSTDENTTLVFSDANHNAIRVSDPDGTIDSTLQVTLSVDQGSLSLARTFGLTFTAGGNGTGTMTFTGTQANINVALDGLKYTPAMSTSGQYIESATIHVITSDSAPEMMGGSQTTPSEIGVKITAPWVYNGLLGTYYPSGDFTGIGIQRVDSSIDFNWGADGSPIDGVQGSTAWSARWLGTIQADYSETYTFYTTANDGVRLWVNNVLLIDRLDNTGTDSYSASIDLVAGQQYTFRMDYRQVDGDAYAKLEWSSANQTREVVSTNHLEAADRTPTIIVPAQQNGIGGQPIIFSPEARNAIALTELHYQGNDLTVTITASQGTLTLSSGNSVTVTGGADASNTITFSGTLDEINAALDGLCYTRGNGLAASITITATDSSPTTGARSSTSTVQIGEVQQSKAGLVATYYSDTWLGTPASAQIDSKIAFTWGNTAPVAGVTANNWSARWEGLIQTCENEAGAYTFSATSAGGCRLWVNGELVIDNWDQQESGSKSGTITLAANQKYSIRMEYCQYGTADMVELKWTRPSDVTQVVPIDRFSHQAQAPVHYLPTSASVYEGANASVTFSAVTGNAISISDVDAQSSDLRVVLTSTNGTLSLAHSTGLKSVTGNGSSDSPMILTGTLSNINAALDGLKFTPTADYTGGATLHISTTDTGTGLSKGNSLPITVLAVNHAPTVDAPNPQNVNEGQTLTFSTNNGNAITIGDPDIKSTSYATVLNGDFNSPHVGTGPDSYTYRGPVDGWTFTAYYESGIGPNASFLAGHGSDMGNPESINDSPVACIQGGATISQDVFFSTAGTYTIDFLAASRLVGGQHSFEVQIDGVSVGRFTPEVQQYNAYSATFSIAQGNTTHNVTFRGLNEVGNRTVFIDRVSIAKSEAMVQVTLSVDHGTLTLPSNLGLTFSDQDGRDDATMTFKGSLAAVNAVLEGLQFTPTAGYTGSAVLRVTTNDLGNIGVGGPKSSTNTVAINVIAVNHAPTATSPTAVQATHGTQPIVFSTAKNNAISVGDQDEGNHPMQVTLTTTYGSLTLGSQPGGLTVANAIDSNTHTFTMTLTGTKADINAALNGLSYTPTGSHIGYAELNILVDDLGSGVGSSLTAESTVKLYVFAGSTVNSITEGSQQTFAESPQAIAADALGNYVVVWTSESQSGGGLDVFARRFDAAGNALGAEFQVNTSKDEDVEAAMGDQMYATVAMNANGSFVVTWTDTDSTDGSTDVYARAYGDRGIALGDQIRVNSTVANDQKYTSVAMNASGGFVVTWSSQGQDGDGWGIYGQRFDASGNKVDADGNLAESEFQISQTTTGDQQLARLAMDGDGNFTVVWQSENHDGSSGSIVARQFNASGIPVGNEFLVNADTAGDRQNANIGMNASGQFVITWSSSGQDGSGQGIFARQYTASGTPVQGEFRVNTTTAGDQDFASVAVDRQGEFLITWSSKDQDSGLWSVYGQRYTVNGTAKGPETQLSVASSDSQANSSVVNLTPDNYVVVWSGTDGDGSGILFSQQAPTGLVASYYNNTTLSGTPVQRIDANIDATWNPDWDNTHSPAPGIGSDTWSARWEGMIRPMTSGEYTFFARVDDGARLWINGQLIIDSWQTQNTTLTSTPVVFEAGQWYSIKMEYYENYGGDHATLEWSGPGVERQVIPTTQLTHFNAAPTVSQPTAPKVAEGQSLTFSGVGNNAIQIGDVDSLSDSFLTVTLGVDNGTLTLSRTSGLTMLAGDGGNDASMSFRGTLADINAALNGMVYTPTANYRGPASLHIVTTDEGGLGGSQTTTSNIAIDVMGMNISVASPQTVTEHQTLVLSSATHNAIALSGWGVDNSTIQVTLTATHGTVTLSGISGLDSWAGNGTGEVTIRGTIGSINAALDGLQFSPADNYGGEATLTVAATDLGNAGLADDLIAQNAITIDVVAVNDAPINTLPTGTQNAFTQYAKVFSTLPAYNNAISISDPDAVDSTVRVTLSVDQGTVTLSGVSGLQSVVGNGTGTITMEGSISSINAALDGMKYKAKEHFQGTVYLRLMTDDLGNVGIGGAKTTTNTMAINVKEVDAPLVTGITTKSITEHQAVVFSQATGNPIQVIAPDVGDLPVQVTLSTNFGTLSLKNAPQGLHFGAASRGSEIVLTGTVAEINAALDGLTYTPNAVQSGRMSAGIRISVNDLNLGHTDAECPPQVTIATVPVSVIAVNDAPVVTIPEARGYDISNIVFSSATGNAIVIGDPDAGGQPVVMTIIVHDGTFSLASTEGLSIFAGAPTQSSYLQVYGTIADLNKALDGMQLKASSTYAAMQVSVNDQGTNQGVGGAQEGSQVFFVRRMIDPNFQPGNTSTLFQVRSGVMTQQVSTTTESGPRASQDAIRRIQLDSGQINTSLLLSDMIHNMNTVRTDSGVVSQGTERLASRGVERQLELADDKDTKVIEGGLFSADTQSADEPLQQGSVLRRDESILVGLGVVSAGYLAWALHGGSLLAGALSTTPMWMPFDPLAVLDFSDRAAKAGMLPLDTEAGLAGDDNLQSLLS